MKSKRSNILELVHRDIEAIQLADSEMSFLAAVRLVNLGTKTATRPLINVARHSHELHSRVFAIYALRSLRDRRAVTSLIRLAQLDQPEEVRDEAVEALAIFIEKGCRRAIRAVTKSARTDTSPYVRWSAAYSLGHSTDAECITGLTLLLEDRGIPVGRTPVMVEAEEMLNTIVSRKANGNK